MTPEMMVNAALVVLAIFALGWATGREPKSAPVWTLVAAFALSVALVDYMPRERVLAALVAVDALVVVIMVPYAIKGNDRASLVALLSAGKIAFTLLAVFTGIIPNVRAATRNVVFLLQIITAGGGLDVGLAWLGHRAREFIDRRGTVVDRMEGD